MSKNVAMFVDVANLYYSARGQEVDVDYISLLKHATKGRDLIRAYAYSGLDPENENQRKFIDFLGKNGYKVVTKDIRKFGDGRVKANLDIELVVDLFRLARRMDIAVIVSGDGDFAPAIRALQDEGVRCEVISFRPNTSSDLIAVADEFIDIMKIGVDRDAKEGKRDTGMSAPPMPAKEVVPEFGFREASPSVAAAALAALREGKDSKPVRGRGRRARAETPAEAAVVEPAVEAPVGVTESGNGTEPADGRRRRRRRGGRGRGRGRGRAAEAAEAAEAPESGTGEAPEEAPIGWTELDDISQLGELEDELGGMTELSADRGYGFEEADAATLAELGLAPSDEPMEAVPVEGATDADAAPEAASPAGRATRTSRTSRARGGRSRSTAKETDAPAADEAAATPAAEAANEERPKAKPRRRRTKATTPEAEAAETETKAHEAEKATPRRSRRSRAGATAAATTDTAAGAEAAAKKPARRTSRSRRTADESTEGASGASAAEGSGGSESSASGGDETEGIWQRFRSGRTRRGTTSS